MSDQKSTTPTKRKAKPARKRKRRTKKLPPYNVVLLNDDDHTYEYVIEMLRSLFAHSEEKAFQLAKEVDENDRVIVFTTHRELAEMKCEQVQAFGMDWRVATCAGSMSAVIEPAN